MDPASGHGVGVARYIRDRERPDSAEIAFSVLDAWQGRGVGKILLHHLADRAHAEGIRRFTALMLADNRPMRKLFADLGDPVVLDTAPGTSRASRRSSPGGARSGKRGRGPPWITTA